MSISTVTHVENNNDGSLAFLDGLRGLTALYVLLYHATTGLLWEGFFYGYTLHPQIYSAPQKVLAWSSFIVYYGRQAVYLFILLSGFVIHLRYAKRQQTNNNERFDLLPFYWRRFKRIYPPLILALILTYLLDTHGILLVSIARNVLFQWPGGLQSVRYDTFLPRLIWNLTLLPDTLASQWGSNYPFWSLRLEWEFYLLYPALWWLNRRSMAATTGLIVCLCLLSFTPWAQSFIFWQSFLAPLFVWWLGALLAEIYVGRLKIRYHRLMPLMFILLPLLVLIPPFSSVLNYYVRDVLWGVGFMGLLAWLLNLNQRGRSLKFLERLKPLGDMSYTLYITHFPIMIFIGTWLVATSPTHALPISFEWIIVGCAICLIVAWLLHFIVEKPFQRRVSLKTVSTVVVNESSAPV